MTTVVAVGPQQDLGLRPVGPDGPQQPAQEGANFRTFRPLGRTQHGRDEAAIAIEHDDRLEAVFVIMGIEQAQLLATMHGVEGIINVEHDPPRHLPEGGAVEVDHGPPDAQQRSRVRQVLQA
jgi:hypothetical protein